MIGPMPDFMKTKEFELYLDGEHEAGEGIFFKPGAPEWLVKAAEEWMREEDEAEAEMLRGLE